MHFRILISVVMISIAALANQQALGTSASNNASTQTLPALQVEELQALNIGNFTHRSGGTIDVNNDTPANWTIKGGITRLGGSGTVGIGRYRITGAAQRNVVVDLANKGVIKLEGSSNSKNTLDLHLRLHKTNKNRTSETYKLNQNGRKVFKIYGTAELAAGQEVDDYSATYDFTVQYE